ncbi:MAG: DUF3489 domain-containing protein [Syntrophales bacterium]
MASSRKVKENVKKSVTTSKKSAESGRKISPEARKVRGESKQAMLIKLLERADGATIDEMAKLTGWQRHSIRGVMSGVLKKRLGRSIISEKGEGGRIYRLVAQ